MRRWAPRLLPIAIAAALTACGGGDHRAGRSSTRAPGPTIGAGSTAPVRAPAPTPGARRPQIEQSPIPFGPRRKAEMRAYEERHYGRSTYRLEHPKVIVEHYTASETYDSAYQTFAPDVPDSGLNELPGLCAHFIIDKDGTIHQLVPLDIACRHTVGLNWTAIGIEHVGVSDGEILGNHRQLDASLRLTRWLQRTYGINTRDVIGHNESLGSPYHRERVASLRRSTHDDFQHATMQRYRRLL